MIRGHDLFRRIESLQHLTHRVRDVAGEYVRRGTGSHDFVDRAPASGIKLLHPLFEPPGDQRLVQSGHRRLCVQSIAGHEPPPPHRDIYARSCIKRV